VVLSTDEGLLWDSSICQNRQDVWRVRREDIVLGERFSPSTHEATRVSTNKAGLYRCSSDFRGGRFDSRHDCSDERAQIQTLRESTVRSERGNTEDAVDEEIKSREQEENGSLSSKIRDVLVVIP
jgi:hypothetical protein